MWSFDNLRRVVSPQGVVARSAYRPAIAGVVSVSPKPIEDDIVRVVRSSPPARRTVASVLGTPVHNARSTTGAERRAIALPGRQVGALS